MKEKRCDWKKLLCMVLVAVFVVQLVPSSVLAEMVESVQAPEKREGTVIATETDEPATIQGDVVKLIKADGTAVASYTYDPWGKILTSTGDLANINPLRYRGYYYDTETGLYYLQSRYYDPEIGRFINADTYTTTDSTGILSANMYAYCENDPVNRNDPSGRWVHIAVGAALGAVSSLLGGWADGKKGGDLLRTALIGAASGALSAAFPGYGLAIDIVADCIDSGFDIMQGKHDEVPENIATGVNSIVFSLFNSTQDSYLTSVEFSNDIESVNELKGKTTPGNHPKVKKAATKGISHAGRSIGKKASREVVFGAAVDALKNGVNWLLKAIF